MTTTAELLLAWDRRRARSQQREIGMSEVGGCRRRAGYRLAGTPPTNPGGSVQAVMGTAVHSAVESVYREMQTAGEIPAEDLVEYEVRFAGVLGHLDRYEAATATVHDTKTTSQRWLDHIILNGPDRQHEWQIHLYGAALVAEKRPVRRLVLDYLARDTGNDHQVVMRFNPAKVREALAWLDSVRAVDVEMLNREYQPDSAFCAHCPFQDTCWGDAVPDRDPLSALFVEHPDGVEWASRLDKVRAEIKRLKEIEKETVGALDALRPNESGSSDPVDVGYDKCLKWTFQKSYPLDTDTVKQEYQKVGAKPPTREQVAKKLLFVPKPQPQEVPS